MQVAAKFSSGLGRKIVHVRVSKEESAQHHMEAGVPEHYAKFLAWLEADYTKRVLTTNDVVERVIGRPPQNFDAWIQENKSALQ